MKAAEFRKLALALPEAEENEHHGHPDFRVGGKIFATLGPDEDWAMVKLNAPEQAVVIREKPEAYSPIPGAWGARGYTRIELARATRGLVLRALHSAWTNTAPRKLAREHELDGV